MTVTQSPLADDESGVAPPVADGIPVRWLDPAAPWAAEIGADPAGKRLVPFLAARVSLRFDDTKAGLDTTQEWEAVYGPLDSGLDLDRETAVDYDDRDLRDESPDGAAYVLPSVPLDKAAFFRDAAREIQRRLADTQTLELLRNAELDLYSRPGETQEQFAARADEAAKAAADTETAKIRDRLETKHDRLERALETARQRVEQASVEQTSRRSTELLSGLGSVVGVLLGGKADTRTIARAGRALGGAASRRGMSTRALGAEGDRRGEGRARRDRPRGARAGDPGRGGRDRREVGGEGRRGRDDPDPARGRRRPRRSDDARVGSDGLRLVALLAVVLCAACGGMSTPAGTATVDSVRDGDTILLENGRRVRLVQVDAPELGVECWGDEAAARSRPARPAGNGAAARA